MEEIKKMHDLDIEWGCITNLMDKISNLEDRIEGGWPELIDMVGDAVTEEGENKDPASAFFNLYAFLWHLYYRIKTHPEKKAFNIYEHTEWGTSKEDIYLIENYDYAAFKWAVKSGFSDRIDNDRIIISADKLTTKQQKAFDHRCKERRPHVD